MNFSLLILLMIFIYSTSGIQISKDKNKKYCFQFTWPGSIKTNTDTTNCTALENMKIPCIEKIIISESLPDFEKIWSDKDTRNEYSCSLTRGYSCIKYTYSFDNAITNATYFCGKMIQNKETAIQEGCFNQKIGGYNIETCACQSTGFGNGMPCNSSTERIFSFTISVLLLMLLSIM